MEAVVIFDGGEAPVLSYQVHDNGAYDPCDSLIITTLNQRRRDDCCGVAICRGHQYGAVGTA